MDAGTNIKSTLPNMFGGVGTQPVSEIPGADLEPAGSLSAFACDAQFIAGSVATMFEENGPPLPYATAGAPAVARESDIKFDQFDVAEIFKKTPCIADLQPRGRDVAKDMFKAGDIPLLMKTLLDNGHLHGDCFTVRGRTIAENLKSASWSPCQDVARSADKPATTAAVVGLKGNLAPDMALAKVEYMSNLNFTGAARCFDHGYAAHGARDGHVGAAVGPLNINNIKLIEPGQADLKTKWRLRTTNHTSETLSKYAELGPTAGGAVTRPGGAYEKQCYVDI